MNKSSIIFIAILLLAQVVTPLAVAKMNDCTFDITIRVALMGDGATEEFEQKVKDSVNQYWNKGFKVGDCGCEFKVTVITKRMENCSDETSADPSFACINVVNTRGVNRAHVTMFDWTKGLSSDEASTSSGHGIMEGHASPAMIAHEFGHLMALPDEYTDHYKYFVKNKTTGAIISGPHLIKVDDWYRNGRNMQSEADRKGQSFEFQRSSYGFKHSVPNNGSEDSLMGNIGANSSVKQRHVDSIFEKTRLKCPDHCCCGNSKIDESKGEECDPKANPTGCMVGETCSKKCNCEMDELPDIEYVCGDGMLGIGEECDFMALESGCASGMICSPMCVCESPVNSEITMEIINPVEGVPVFSEEPVVIEYSDIHAIGQVSYEIDGFVYHLSDEPLEEWVIVPGLFDEGEHILIVTAYDHEFNPYSDSVMIMIEHASPG